MAAFLVTLNDDEIISAVSEWAEKHHGIKARKVNVSAEMKWTGSGMTDERVPMVKVTIES